jgi:hypothetical protein
MRNIGLIWWLLAVLASAAGFAAFFLDNDANHRTLVVLSEVFVIAVGFVGGVKGFIKYIIRGEPGPLEKARQQNREKL